MGMVLELVALDDANLRRVVADPPLVAQVLFPDDLDVYEDARAEAKTAPWWRRLFRRASAVEVADIDCGDAAGLRIDLDKAWHGIHWLLSDRVWEGSVPGGFLLAGQAVAIELGYGEPRVLTSAETREVAAMLDDTSTDELRARWDPERMMALEIYPEIWDRGDEELDYLIDYFGDLKAFVRSVADRGLGLVLAIL